jgi:hypothetical protein
VIIVGGSTRMPKVQEAVKKFFGKEPKKDVNPICDALVGMVVFFSINLVITPPIVSIPSDNGVTSNNKTSFL